MKNLLCLQNFLVLLWILSTWDSFYYREFIKDAIINLCANITDHEEV